MTTADGMMRLFGISGEIHGGRKTERRSCFEGKQGTKVFGKRTTKTKPAALHGRALSLSLVPFLSFSQTSRELPLGVPIGGGSSASFSFAPLSLSLSCLLACCGLALGQDTLDLLRSTLWVCGGLAPVSSITPPIKAV